MTGIYKITSPSNKIYIGQSRKLENRLKSYYTNSKAKSQPKLKASLEKYGTNEHVIEIVTILPNDVTQDILDTYEQLYMDLYRDCGLELLNVREAGNVGTHSEDTRKKMSIAAIGNTNGRNSQKNRKKPYLPNSGTWQKGHKPANMKAIIATHIKSGTTYIFESISDFAKFAGLTTNTMAYHVLKGRKNQTKGYSLSYKN